MRKNDLCKAILAAVLAAGLAVSAAGCQGKEETADTESKTSAVESSAESSKEPEVKKTPEEVLKEQNVKLCTLDVREVPYESDLDFENLEPAENVTLMYVLVAGAYDKKEFRAEGIETTSGENEYRMNNDKTEQWYSSGSFNVSKTKYGTKDGEIYRIICSGKADPSDFCLKFSSMGKIYTIPFSNEKTSVPENYVMTDSSAYDNIVSFDGRTYYLDGVTTRDAGHFYLGSGEHTFHTEKIVSFTILNADSEKPDISKFSYEPITEVLDEMTLAHISDVKVEVSTVDGFEDKGTDCQYDEVELDFSYTIHADTTVEEYDHIVNAVNLMVNHGYLVYNGDKGTTKILLTE